MKKSVIRLRYWVFVFRGTYTYALAISDNRLKAAVPFYGHAPEPLDKIKDITCPILAFYGENDKALVDGLPELEMPFSTTPTQLLTTKKLLKIHGRETWIV